MSSPNWSGKAAERHVQKVFGVSEPEIEVKSWARHVKYLKIKLTQLERHVADGKHYFVVCYDRRRTCRKGRVRFGRSVTAAMKEATVYRWSASTLIGMVSNSRSIVRWVQDRQGHDRGAFYVLLTRTSLGLNGESPC